MKVNDSIQTMLLCPAHHAFDVWPRAGDIQRSGNIAWDGPIPNRKTEAIDLGGDTNSYNGSVIV